MSRLVLSHATVVDGDHGAIADAHVVVDDDRIAAVGTGPFSTWHRRTGSSILVAER